MNGDGLSGSIADERKSVLISAYDAGSNALYKLSEDEREDALTSCRIDFVGTSEGNMGEKIFLKLGELLCTRWLLWSHD